MERLLAIMILLETSNSKLAFFPKMCKLCRRISGNGTTCTTISCMCRKQSKSLAIPTPNVPVVPSDLNESKKSRRPPPTIRAPITEGCLRGKIIPPQGVLVRASPASPWRVSATSILDFLYHANAAKFSRNCSARGVRNSR